MDRRTFTTMFVCAIGATAGSFAWFLSREATQTDEEHLREYYSYLKLRDGTVEAYIADHRRYRGPLPDPPWRETVYTEFLMSTDFFRYAADEQREVSYLVFYDPSQLPCSNPFAVFAG